MTFLNIPMRQWLVQFYFGMYHLKYGRQPIVPLSKILKLRNLAGKEDEALAVPLSQTTSTGRMLRNRYLSDVLAQDELGRWSLDATVLNLLEREISTRRPEAILEFGAGISTICFARYMTELHGVSGTPYVYSIEQNREYVQGTRERLAELGLEQVVSIIHAPLKKQVIEGLESECYDLPANLLDQFLGGVRPDFVVIDGPAGDVGVRLGTLPLVRNYLQNKAAFFLDDALRDGELQIAVRWTDQSYVSALGICLCGKGVFAGEVLSD